MRTPHPDTTVQTARDGGQYPRALAFALARAGGSRPPTLAY